MKKPHVIVIAVFCCVCAFLFFKAANQGVSLVFTPEELVREKEDRQRIRVAGRVAESSIQYSVDPQMLLTFSIHDPGEEEVQAVEGALLPVRYEGLKPDMFAAGRDVIVDGDYQDGTLVAHRLLTQCPSKYEAPDPAGQMQQEK